MEIVVAIGDAEECLGRPRTALWGSVGVSATRHEGRLHCRIRERRHDLRGSVRPEMEQVSDTGHTDSTFSFPQDGDCIL